MKETSDIAEQKLPLRRGAVVERYIEGVWFTASVEEIDMKSNPPELSLRYLDDGNVEIGVSASEIRTHQTMENTSIVAEDKADNRKKHPTLPKPLLGLIEDDADLRLDHKPTVIIHDAAAADTEEAIILNGAENKLAAGGGLRALRYLKH